ncbi:UGSC family (seleno)protein [Saccharopolyspora sp. 5N708]|uniref:UGSC family (seleno)protein n=1 Tax=Saccharopolyspora sp. 5N708 TaxID=3457424 RepID=UPI003FD30FE0
MPNAILDPTGRAATQATAATATRAPTTRAPMTRAPMTRAQRRRNLAGARIGLLENTKQNAALLLTELGELLVSEHGASAVVLMRTKTAFAQPAPAELIAEYARECDVVITGVGDCGSCSASAVADGILFERAGLPAAVICSDAFIATADAMAELRSAPGYEYVTTEHPVAILTQQQVQDRAKDVLPGVVALFTAAGS